MELITIYFEPKPDITAYELARIFARTGVGDGHCPAAGLQIPRAQFADMVPEIKRHFAVRGPLLS